MWLYGVNLNEWKFVSGNTRKVIELCSQRMYPRYEEFDTVKSFVYRTIGNRLVIDDDVMSSAVSKVKRGLLRHGFNISLSTVYHTEQNLSFGWTKP